MSEGDFVLTTNRIPSFSEFLDMLQIKSRSFGAQLFQNVYDEIFVVSKDLRKEYEKYYCVEYPDFESYLDVAHEIHLNPAQLEKLHVLSVESPISIVNDTYDDNVRDKIFSCIRKMEGNYED